MADQNIKGEVINIVVKDGASSEVQFKVRTTTKFAKLFQAYSDKKAVEANSLKFHFDGERLRGDQTPADLSMEDGDVVDVFIEALGGGC